MAIDYKYWLHKKSEHPEKGFGYHHGLMEEVVETKMVRKKR